MADTAIFAATNLVKSDRADVKAIAIVQVLGVLAFGACSVVGGTETTVICLFNAKSGASLACPAEFTASKFVVPIGASVLAFTRVQVLGVFAFSANFVFTVTESTMVGFFDTCIGWLWGGCLRDNANTAEFAIADSNCSDRTGIKAHALIQVFGVHTFGANSIGAESAVALFLDTLWDRTEVAVETGTELTTDWTVISHPLGVLMPLSTVPLLCPQWAGFRDALNTAFF